MFSGQFYIWYTSISILPLSQNKCSIHFGRHLKPWCRSKTGPYYHFSGSPWCLVCATRRWVQGINSHGHSCHKRKRSCNWKFQKTRKVCNFSTKTARPKFSKIHQKSNFGPIVRSHMWKLVRRARPFRFFRLN